MYYIYIYGTSINEFILDTVLRDLVIWPSTEMTAAVYTLLLTNAFHILSFKKRTNRIFLSCLLMTVQLLRLPYTRSSMYVLLLS